MGLTGGMIDWSECPAVESVPGKLSGAWVFKNTRLPISALFDNVASGATVREFVEWFPGVEEAQVVAVLEFAARHSKYPGGAPVLPEPAMA
jgi:uncharacterized protein (DUF433 family)